MNTDNALCHGYNQQGHRERIRSEICQGAGISIMTFNTRGAVGARRLRG